MTAARGLICHRRPRREVLKVRLRAADHERLREEAEALGVTLSALVRARVLNEALPLPPGQSARRPVWSRPKP